MDAVVEYTIMIDKNGFSLPLHPFQILSWVIFTYHTIIPVLLIYPFLEKPLAIFFLTIFYLAHFTVIVSGYLATKSNPTIKVSKDPIYLETTENLNFYCTICESYVTKTSKHCGSCDRCVDGFDHHCKWLNNCIGQVNYRLFIILIVFLEISEIILLSFEIKALSIYENDTIFGLIVFDTILNGLVVFLVGYLVLIHVMLKIKGMTTYEYIKALRKRKEKKISPGMPTEGNENKTFEKKSLSMKKEVKKSIIKATMNKTVMDNVCSFSVAKQSIEDAAHMTLQLKFDLDSSNIIVRE